MISLPFRRPNRPNIDALYGMIVAQARTPAFYRDYGVPDTVEGRLDMLVLHVVLLLRGLAPLLGQQLFDRFCQDIDDNFREMGIGDLAVPKEMRKVAEAFYGRAQAYETALAAGDTAALETAVARNVFGATAPTLGACALAAYIRHASASLGCLSPEDVARGAFQFPSPAAMTAGASQDECG
jgi:cytochrome b pre-mRNA-processing protein 3